MFSLLLTFQQNATILFKTTCKIIQNWSQAILFDNYLFYYIFTALKIDTAKGYFSIKKREREKKNENRNRH